MTETLRAELDRIQEFLLGTEGFALANVLAALRGPDDGDEVLKTSTTNFIRTAAFPNIDQNFHLPWTTSHHLDGFTTKYDELRERGTDNPVNYHFISHIRSAAVILGLGEGL